MLLLSPLLGEAHAHRGAALRPHSRAPPRRRAAAAPRLSLADLGDLEDGGACAIDERCIYFVTGNAMKRREVDTILSDAGLPALGLRVQHIKIDLPELQGSSEMICREKCAEAAERVGGAVLVEDTSLCFNALGGMPGPYIKFFMKACGNEGLHRMLAGFEDRSAYCQCVLGFSPGPGAEPRLWVGRTDGRIEPPSGEGGFGWDASFVPDESSGSSYAELSLDEKNRISHRAAALAQFVAYCREHPGMLEEIEVWNQPILEG